MKKMIYRALGILLACGLATGIFVVGKREMDYRKGQADYDHARQLAGVFGQDGEAAFGLGEDIGEGQGGLAENFAEGFSADPYGAGLAKIDLSALKKVNDEVIGWIAIPDSDLSYPLLKGKDNQYYLNHTWKKEHNPVGAIYLDCQVDSGLDDFNTIIYGHRMRNLSMFGTLKFYADIQYWEKHPYIYLAVENGVYRYRIYSAYEAALDKNTYSINIADQNTKKDFFRYGVEHSVIDTGVVPTEDDRVITLSTCTGSGHSTRWVVQAVREAYVCVEEVSNPQGRFVHSLR